MDGAQRFGRYTVTGTLGRGAMGHVYAAVDDVLGRSVAVKTLHGGATGLAARMLDDRFRMEARAIAALNHPGIVQVYDIDLAADPPYLVMERMAGPSLKEQFEKGPVPANELRALGIQIARALAAAHAAGIVHRDVKPANVLVAGAGTWKLADFGVAHVPDSSLTMTGQFIGSPAYAPPEALLRGQSTAAGDVFGLGATLYYGAAGSWPRADATNAGLLAPIPSVRTLAPHLPADLITTIDQAVHIVPDQRPTATALADALAAAAPWHASLSTATQTQFVPDAIDAGSQTSVLTGPAVTRPAPVETAFVPDATQPPRARTAPPAPMGLRWKPWAVGGGLLAAAIVVGVAVGGSKPAAVDRVGTPSVTTGSFDAPATGELPAVDALPELPLPPPGEIRAITPPMPERKAGEDWNKIVDDLYNQKFGNAKRRLADFERRWGESRETRNLRMQLEQLPPANLADDE